MATLTEAAYYSRKFIKYGSILLVTYVVLRLSFTLFNVWWQRTHPQKPPPPKSEFGPLPRLPFPDQAKPIYKFNLQTITGDTGKYDEQIKVYLMPTKKANLLALERATELARKLDFLFEPTQISETQYIWYKDDPLPASLSIDTVTGHFTYKAEWGVRPDILVGVSAPSRTEAINNLQTWITALDLNEDDISFTDAKLAYLKLEGTEIVPALSQSEAQFIRIDLARKPVNEIIIWPSYLDKGFISVTFIPSSLREIVVVEADYNYLPVDYEHFGNYPLITSQEAWEKLQAGEGYYAFYPENVSTIAIRRVSLGYYDPPVSGFFLQPIFIFEGDDGFVGYIQAVAEESLAPKE